MTKLQFRVLYHEFLVRMVDLELLSAHAQGDASTLLGQFAALLIFISLGLSMAAVGFADAGLPPPEFVIASWSAEHFLIATTMLVVGLFAVLRWESTFPDRRDVLVLAPLPIRARTLFLAKVAAAATALSLSILALHLPAGLIWPFVLNRHTPRRTIPTLTSDPAMPPVKAADLQAVLNRDLPKMLRPGAGLAIGVSEHGVRRVFAYGTAKPDSLFEIGSITKMKFDEPVRLLLPPGTVGKPAGSEITLLDLATQHSGLRRMPSNFHLADKADPYADYHAADLYEYLWDFDALAGAGGLRSTAGDMLIYLEANLRPDEETYRHGGATPGYTADAFFNPKSDYAAVVLSNTGPGTVLSAEITAEHIRRRMAGLPAISLASTSIPASGGLLGLLRLFAVYWITMLASGAFIFCCVLGVQGLAAQLLPRALFLRASSFLQLTAFCLFVSVYFLQPMLAMPSDILNSQSQGPPAWSPSYWFLGLFQQLNGSPALAPLATRAWIGLALAIGGTAAAYALSYFRTLRKIAEEPDIVPGSRSAHWLPKFGSPLQTALVQFSIRTLFRSRQHRVVLAFYVGIAFAATIVFLKSSTASSILLMGYWVLGIRVVFSLPLDLRANWIFRIAPLRGGGECFVARRRSLLVLSVLPVWLGSAVLFLSIWPWRPALGHLAILALLGVIISEICLAGNQKIPFTCSWLPGKSNFHITFWMCSALLIQTVSRAAEYEGRLLANPGSYATVLAILAAAAVCARLRNKSEEDTLVFEEVPSWKLVTLKLP